MILVDTSVWVEFLRATGSASHRRLAGLIEAGQPIAVSEPIWMELLAGAREPERRRELDRFLAGFELLAVDGLRGFRLAADVYLGCREAGYTPRNMIDCLIAAVAIENRASLLHVDGDFDRIAESVPLEVAQPR